MGTRLFRNRVMKLTSVLLALLLWAAVNFQDEETRTLQVSLQLPELPDSLMYESTPNPFVSVQFRAKAAALFWLKQIPPRLEVDFAVQEDSEARYVPLNMEALQLSRQFTGDAISISPDHLAVKILKVGEVVLPVHVDIAREPQKPWALEGIPMVRPARVSVRGPANEVPYLSHRGLLYTEALDLTEYREDVELEVAIIPPNITGVQLSEETVKVRLRIEKGDESFTP